jgi:hypothetical protein
MICVGLIFSAISCSDDNPTGSKTELVRTFSGHADAGSIALVWDQLDEDGEQVPEGDYELRLFVGGELKDIRTIKIDNTAEVGPDAYAVGAPIEINIGFPQECDYTIKIYRVK